MKKNLISSFLIRGLSALCNFAILLVSARFLGSEVLGQAGILIVNIAIVQSVVEIYSGSSLVHFIPNSSIKKIYSTGIVWIICSSVLLNLVLSFLGVASSSFAIHGLALSLLLCLHSFNQIILLGKEKITTYNIFTLLQPLLVFSGILIQIFIFHHSGFSSYLFALYFSFIIIFILSSLAIKNSLFQNEEAKNGINFRKIFSNGFINEIANLSHTLSNRLNYYLLAAPAIVGVYSCSTSLIESLWIIPTAISPIILSRVANTQNENSQHNSVLLLSKISFLLCICACLVLIFIPSELFSLLLGKDFSETKKVMLFLAPGICCISFSAVISHYFSGLGKQKIQLGANLSGFVVAAIFSYALIPLFGICGAAMSASLGYATQSFVITLIFFQQNNLNLKNLLSFR